MPATETLNTLTVLSNLSAGDGSVLVSDTSNLFPGVRVFYDGELMSVVRVGISSNVDVLRGVDGSRAVPHVSGGTAYVGRADQFYSMNPHGRPNDSPLVSPYINVVNGTVWLAQGDTLPPGLGQRWWQQVTTTYGSGAMGITTTTVEPTTPS